MSDTSLGASAASRKPVAVGDPDLTDVERRWRYVMEINLKTRLNSSRMSLSFPYA